MAKQHYQPGQKVEVKEDNHNMVAVTMTISKGKFLALLDAFRKNGSPIETYLLELLEDSAKENNVIQG